MKKIVLTSLVFFVMMASVFAEAKLIFTTSLDSKNAPTDKLTEIPFDKDHEFIMFLYNDDNTAFGVEKVYFEINIYNEDKEKYEYADMYTVNTKTDWGYCYKGILFNNPIKLKVHVFTNAGDLTTQYITIVK